MLRNPAAFFAAVRTAELFGSTMLQAQVDGCNRLLDAFGKAQWPVTFAAYGLATDFHETAHSMTPVRERGTHVYLARYDTGALAKHLGNTPGADGDGEKYAGHGDAQVTGLDNYKRFDAALDLGGRLVADPDILIKYPQLSAAVLVIGMSRGMFTGKKLGDYLPRVGSADRAEFSDARRIINGSDRADMIAGFAVAFQTALVAGQWGP